jgi:pilus assembly protein CpaF
MNNCLPLGHATHIEAILLERMRTENTLDVRHAAELLCRELSPLETGLNQRLIIDQVVANLEGLGPLDEFLHDPAVTEVMVQRGEVWIDRGGELSQVDGVSMDEKTVLRIVERVLAPLGLQLNRAIPMVDARLADGSRLNVIIAPLAIDGPAVTIRRFRTQTVELRDFCTDEETFETLCAIVDERRNIVVSGATGSGKTTLLNALASRCDPNHRIITIEDAAELRLPIPHVVRLEARVGGADGSGRVTVRDLVRNSLRMRPDRLIIGEVRGAEALDMVTALNTGHAGSMSTVHANSSADALRRLELMLTLGVDLPLHAIQQQLAAAIDVVVHLARDAQGRRVVIEVASVSYDLDGLTTRALGGFLHVA